jgi:hypothetical protein
VEDEIAERFGTAIDTNAASVHFVSNMDEMRQQEWQIGMERVAHRRTLMRKQCLHCRACSECEG